MDKRIVLTKSKLNVYIRIDDTTNPDTVYDMEYFLNKGKKPRMIKGIHLTITHDNKDYKYRINLDKQSVWLTGTKEDNQNTKGEIKYGKI